MKLAIEYDREEDGSWIADLPAIPGVLVNGATQDEAKVALETLAREVVADMLAHGEEVPSEVREYFAVTV